MAPTSRTAHFQRFSDELSLVSDCAAPKSPVSDEERRIFLRACAATLAPALRLVSERDPAALIQAQLHKLPEQGDLVLDLSGIESLTSSALAHCLRALHQLEQRGQHLILKNASEAVQDTLFATRVDRRLAKAA